MAIRMRWEGVAILATVLLAVAGANAQTRVEEKVDHALTGQVTAVDPAAGTLTVEGVHGEGGAYRVDDATTILVGGQRTTLAGIHKGDWVALDADREGQADLATYVSIVEDPTPNPCGAGQNPCAGAAKP